MLILPLSFFYFILITIITTLIYGQGRGELQMTQRNTRKQNNNSVDGGGYMVQINPKKKRKKNQRGGSYYG
jgi:hypothetical protein